MSEASFEMVLNELREAAPPAPDRLREQVRGLRPAQSRIRPWLRPALLAAIIVTVVVGALAALVSGPDDARREQSSARAFVPQATSTNQSERVPGAFAAPTLTAKSRLQKQDVAMRLRVDDLSGATQSAVRTTRRLGGFVAGADYATGSKEGNSRLALRVPVTKRADPRRDIRARVTPVDDGKACGAARGSQPVRPLLGYDKQHSG